MSHKSAVVLTCAGLSKRYMQSSCGACTKKEFEKIEGKSVLFRALEPFFYVEDIKAAVVVYTQGMLDRTRESLSELLCGKMPLFFVPGGNTRQESVFNGLSFLNENTELDIELVCIHDGARPFVKASTISSCLWYASLFGGSCPSCAVSDSIVRVNEDGTIASSIDRQGVYTVQTPQAFRLKDIYSAHVKARDEGFAGTDDISVFVNAGFKAVAVEGDPNNKKITWYSDIHGRQEQ